MEQSSDALGIKRCVDYVLGILLGAGVGENVEGWPVAYENADKETGSNAPLSILPSGFWGDAYGTVGSLPKLPLPQIEGVPLLYGTPEVRRDGRRLIVCADVIASAYFLATRYEEWVRPEVRDAHGRFPGVESLAYRAGFLDRPIVDEYAGLLRRWLREVGIVVPEPKRNFAVTVTHDIDHLRWCANPLHPLRASASALLGRQPLRNAVLAWLAALGMAADPFDNVADLIEFDRVFQQQAIGLPVNVVYFVVAGRGGSFDVTYGIESKEAASLLRQIQDFGATVGLHTTYEAGRDPSLIAEEKARLEASWRAPIHHNRYHYLGWREIAHGHALARAGITDDYSLGYADMAGFRLGVCHPIPLFDPIRLEPMRIVEHPLIVMDGTLSKYMALDETAALALCQRLVRRTREHHGEFVMLWHNTALATVSDGYHANLYPRLLDWVAGSTA